FSGLDAGAPQRLLVEAVAGDHLASEVLSQSGEGGHAQVDDRDLVPLLVQTSGEERAHPAAADDDHLHESNVIRAASRNPYGTPRRGALSRAAPPGTRWSGRRPT